MTCEVDWALNNNYLSTLSTAAIIVAVAHSECDFAVPVQNKTTYGPCMCVCVRVHVRARARVRVCVYFLNFP